MPNQIQLNNDNVPIILTQLEQLEKEQLDFDQVDCPIRHIFGPGLYIREMTMPKGAFVLGHHHNFDTMNIMIKGKIQVILGDGTITEFTAPQTFVSPPGRKAAYIVEETIWQNVFATDETDIEKLEAYYLTQTNFCLSRDKELVSAKRKLFQNERDDYNNLLNELGMSENELHIIVEDMSDHIELPYGNYKFQISDSPIQGKGMFATSDIKYDELIGPANIDGKRTILGRRINHSMPPNAIMVRNGNTINLYACRNIKGNNGCDLGEEITVDYRFTILSLNPINELSKFKELICQPE